MSAREAGRGARAARPRAALLAVLLGIFVVVLLPLGSARASAAEGPEFPEVPPAGAPWFGPQLDWSVDTAAGYAGRLGSTPAMYGQRVAYPLTSASTSFLRLFVEQVAEQGAVAVLSLEPSGPLADLEREDAEELAAELQGLHESLGTAFLVRFAPEMNGTWYSWGQQPTAYVAAFRLLAEVVHADAPSARTVWSPVYGAGYPYGAAYGDVDPNRVAEVDSLDTNGDDTLNARDAPYAPYWPGKDAVDWVGLTLYHFGVDRGRIDNELDPETGGIGGAEESSIGFRTDVAPRPGDFRARLEEAYGYERRGSRLRFYDRFAAGFDKPMLVDTGALWLSDPEGDPELEIKRTWWRQVLEADADYPRIRGILWLEERRPEAEARGQVVDWRATRATALADALAADLVGEVSLGPVTRVGEVARTDPAPDPADSTPTPAASGPAPDRGVAPAVLPRPVPAWLLGGAVALVVALLASLLAARVRPAWSYRPSAFGAHHRDARLDVARGVLLLGLVAAHVELLATTDGPVARLMGALVGPEAFVLVAGLAVGVRHDGLVDRAGELGAASTRWRRAAALWTTAVLTSLVVLGLRHLPGTADSAVTRWLPGPGGRDLYAGSDALLEYPPPWWSVRELFVLRTVPWPLSMIGLLVVLALVSPVLVAVLRRRGWWVLLAGSWGLYALGLSISLDVTTGTWESAYPPFAWQVVFVHGLVVAHHRRDLGRLLGRPWLRRTGVAGLVLASTGWLVVALLAVRGVGTVSTHLLDLTDGRDLPAGRLTLLSLAALASYALLTTWWTPISRSVAPVLVKVGRAGIVVLAVHVLLLVLLLAMGGLDLRQPVVRGVVTLGALAVVVLVAHAARSRRSPRSAEAATTE